MKYTNCITQILLIIGGLNWLLVGLFDFNLVVFFFHGNLKVIADIIFTIVGLAAIWQLILFFKREPKL